MSDTTLQVLGICRWSYPGQSGAFRKQGDTLPETRAMLYDAERLALRLFLLEHLVLPPLRAQTDGAFRLVLLMGDQLPARARAAVLRLVSDIPAIEPVFAAEGQDSQDLCRELLLARRDPGAAAVAEFRLDDDDAVGVDFVRRTRQTFAETRALFDRAGMLGIDFSHGYAMHLTDDACSFATVAARNWTPALVACLPPDCPQSVLDLKHTAFWHKMPLLNLLEPMFIRGMHGTNDSSLSLYNGKVRRHGRRRKLRRELRRMFAIATPAVEAAWERQNAWRTLPAVA